jgi:tight adherence protein C
MLLVLALSSAAAAGYLAYAELIGTRATRASLSRVAGYGRTAPAVERTPRRGGFPGTPTLARVALRLAPGRDRAKTAAQLQAAGLARVDTDLFLAGKTGVAVGGILVGFVVGAGGGALSAAALGIVFAAIGFILPDLILGTRVRSRREQMLGEMPNALDLLAVTVEAGLGLDASLARYAETATGPLADEFRLLGTELRVGGSRADVLRRLAERIPAAETKAFVRAVTQADQLGVSLSKTLRQQASDVRIRRQALAEERANKAPVKMLFPTVFCIFPVLFVVVLGPAILSLMETL